jgi:hypothetical protein
MEREHCMNRRIVWVTVGLIAAVVGLATLVGCSSSGGSGVQTGITGVIVDASSNLGIEGMVVTAGGKSAVSTAPAGVFTLGPLTPGKYALVVQPGTLFVAAPGPAPEVTVEKDEVANVGNVYVVEKSSLPPG